ncbi:MAG: CerR family C-terminal domain-containing protein [Alphaproteobacteria bacterium]
MKHVPTSRRAGNVRAADARQRLVEIALDVFDRHGFEGASTRQLATKAKVNLSAIPYYFGGKQGLYHAVADYVADQIMERQKPVLLEIEAALGNPQLPRRDTFELLAGFLESFAMMIVAKPTDRLARFILREQMDPTPAFDVLYTKVMGPMHGVCAGLVARLVGRPADDETVLIKATTLLGQVLVFRAARSLVLRRLGWQGYDTGQVAMIQAVVRQNLTLIFEAGEGEAP